MKPYVCPREDPDVILVGEMRDLETIRLALSAAETDIWYLEPFTPALLLRLSIELLAFFQLRKGYGQGNAF